MNKVLAPFEAQLVEQERKHLEVVVLFVAHHIYHLVDRIVLIAEFCRTDVLSHINGSTVATQQELVVKTVSRKVGPYGIVFLAVHDALFKAFKHFFLAFKISFAFVINLVEINAHALVGFVETCINPFVHHAPQRTHFLVAGFPAAEHGTCFLHQRRSCFSLFLRHALSLEFFDFSFIVLVECHIEITDKVVTLLSGCFRSNAVTPFLPCKH